MVRVVVMGLVLTGNAFSQRAYFTSFPDSKGNEFKITNKKCKMKRSLSVIRYHQAKS
jgi:hypothetical protein